MRQQGPGDNKNNQILVEDEGTDAGVETVGFDSYGTVAHVRPNRKRGRPDYLVEGGNHTSKRAKRDRKAASEVRMEWTEYNLAVEQQTMYVIQCADAIAYVKTLERTGGQPEWYPPYGCDQKKWLVENKKHYNQYHQNIKKGDQSQGTCCGYNLNHAANQLQDLFKTQDKDEVTYYHRIRHRALEYCLAMYAANCALQDVTVDMFLPSTVNARDPEANVLLYASTYKDLEEALKATTTTPANMRENDWYIIRSILSTLATVGIIAAGVYDPRLLINKVLGNPAVPSNSVNSWVKSYAKLRNIDSGTQKGAGYNLATCQVIAPASQESATPIIEPHAQLDNDQGTQSEMEADGYDDEPDVLPEDEAIVPIMGGGHNRGQLFDVSTMTDFVKYVSHPPVLIYC